MLSRLYVGVSMLRSGEGSVLRCLRLDAGYAVELLNDAAYGTAPAAATGTAPVRGAPPLKPADDLTGVVPWGGLSVTRASEESELDDSDSLGPFLFWRFLSSAGPSF